MHLEPCRQCSSVRSGRVQACSFSAVCESEYILLWQMHCKTFRGMRMATHRKLEKSPHSLRSTDITGVDVRLYLVDASVDFDLRAIMPLENIFVNTEYWRPVPH